VMLLTSCRLHCDSKKNVDDIIDRNLKKNYQILMTYDTVIPDATGRQMTVRFSTSPNVCFCTTWGKQNQRNITFSSKAVLLLYDNNTQKHILSTFLSLWLTVYPIVHFFNIPDFILFLYVVCAMLLFVSVLEHYILCIYSGQSVVSAILVFLTHRTY